MKNINRKVEEVEKGKRKKKKTTKDTKSTKGGKGWNFIRATLMAAVTPAVVRCG
jgi:hypothetical protein